MSSYTATDDFDLDDIDLIKNKNNLKKNENFVSFAEFAQKI